MKYLNLVHDAQLDVLSEAYSLEEVPSVRLTQFSDGTHKLVTSLRKKENLIKLLFVKLLLSYSEDYTISDYVAAVKDGSITPIAEISQMISGMTDSELSNVIKEASNIEVTFSDVCWRLKNLYSEFGSYGEIEDYLASMIGTDTYDSTFELSKNGGVDMNDMYVLQSLINIFPEYVKLEAIEKIDTICESDGMAPLEVALTAIGLIGDVSMSAFTLTNSAITLDDVYTYLSYMVFNDVDTFISFADDDAGTISSTLPPPRAIPRAWITSGSGYTYVNSSIFNSTPISSTTSGDTVYSGASGTTVVGNNRRRIISARTSGTTRSTGKTLTKTTGTRPLRSVRPSEETIQSYRTVLTSNVYSYAKEVYKESIVTDTDTYSVGTISVQFLTVVVKYRDLPSGVRQSYFTYSDTPSAPYTMMYFCDFVAKYSPYDDAYDINDLSRAYRDVNEKIGDIANGQSALRDYPQNAQDIKPYMAYYNQDVLIGSQVKSQYGGQTQKGLYGY